MKAEVVEAAHDTPQTTPPTHRDPGVMAAPTPNGHDHVIRVTAGRRARVLDLRDIWAYRELLYFLAWRDVKVRYKQTLLGAAWAILQPVASMLVFTLFFGKLARIPTDGVPYPIFVYAGLFRGPFLPMR